MTGGRAADGTRLALFTEWWVPPGSPGSTGGTIYNYRLVEALATAHPIEVHAFYGPELGRATETVPLRRLNEPRSVPGQRLLMWRPRLRRALLSLSPETIVVTTTAANAALPDAQSMGLRTVTIVQAYEDFGWATPSASPRARLAAQWRLWGTGQLWGPGVRHADRVVVNSAFMLDAYRRRLSTRQEVEVLRPPLDLPIDLSPGDPLRDRTVGFVHRAGKNLRFCLALARACPELRFRIHGHPLPPATLLPPNVEHVGWTRDRIGMYRGARAWIVPSKWEEPFGMVAVEALSQGCAVAVARRGGLPEAVGRFGRVFDGYRLEPWCGWLRSACTDGGDASRDTTPLRVHLEALSVTRFADAARRLFS